MAEISTSQSQANGIEQAYLQAGSGPPILLLHGFPDNAWTWEQQITDLATRGYRTIAPFLRGCPPSDVPRQPFDTEDVIRDVKALVDAVAAEPAFVVGHDWGALAALGVASLFPDSVRGVVAIGAGHPATAIEIFKSPPQLHYAFHVWLFQLRDFAEFALRHDDFALVDYLWHHWSEQPVDETHVARVKRGLGEPGAVEAALSYYRGLVAIPSQKPDFFQRVTDSISVPTLVVYGAHDPAQQVSAREDAHFSGPYRREIIGGAGHFVQREQPDRLTALLLEWLRSHDSVHASQGE